MFMAGEASMDDEGYICKNEKNYDKISVWHKKKNKSNSNTNQPHTKPSITI